MNGVTGKLRNTQELDLIKINMATELPFYKFEVLPYLTGDICLERWELQGIFNNVCAFYWSKNCDVSFVVLKKRYAGFENLIEELINLDIFKVDGDYLSIDFLNEQWASKETQKIVNTINGKKGGRPRKENSIETEIKPIRFNFANRSNNPNITNIDKIILDNNREDEKRKEDFVFTKKKSDLIDSLVLHFNFTAPKWFQNRSAIMQFVNTQIKDEDDIENFKIQFSCYQEYKILSKETIHNFQGYLGTPAKEFRNAGWNSENWEEKLAKFKSNPNKLTKFERTVKAFNDAENPYRKND